MTSYSFICRIDAHLVAIYGALIATAFMAMAKNSWLSALASHGKTRSKATQTIASRRDTKTILSKQFRRFNESLVVPKRFFLHFYVVGWIALVAATIADTSTTSAAASKALYETPLQLSLVLLVIHLTRRLLECLFVHVWRDASQMHMIAYALGLLHYLLLPMVFIDVGSCRNEHTRVKATLTTSLVILLAISVNLYAQYMQHRHHVLLAALRQPPKSGSSSSSSNRKYDSPTPLYTGPPRTAWFQYIACPHYLAEIIMYASLTVLQPSVRSLSLLVWVVINLTVSARQTHAWYMQNVPDYRERQLYCIIPGVL